METNQSFGRWLGERRRGLDLTQAELARRASCALITIKKIQTDQMRPSKELAEVLVRQLGAAPAEVDALVHFARGGPPPGLLPAKPRRENLPAALTSFIDRKREIQDVRQLLENHRLVTLTGSGGVGKTRLSLQVAAEVLDQFPDGVWFVELAPLNDSALIPPTVLRLLGLSAGAAHEPLDVLKDYLTSKSLLLILDNCEHLLDAACGITHALLQVAPRVKIMPTSRQTLGVAGEQAYRVPSLDVPDVKFLPPLEQLTQFDAVHLFIDRAALVSPGFSVTDSSAQAIAQICYRLDGIPLAIELAAARVQSMPLDAIVSRLDDRFQLLTGGPRTVPPRQQTLRATIDWSYNLLSKRERQVLQCLSVFRGSWSLEASEAVCAIERVSGYEIDDLLSRLIDKSLISLDQQGRYQMLETVRQYAEEKLIESGRAERACDQHLRYVVKLAEQAEPQVRGPDQLSWLDRLDAELGNLRAAIHWVQRRDRMLFLRLASALLGFWQIRVADAECLKWLAQALELTQDCRSAVRARAMARAAERYSDSYNPLASQYAQQAIALGEELGDKLSTATALVAIGSMENFEDNPTRVATLGNALTLSREIGQHSLAAQALQYLAVCHQNQNDLPVARSFYEQALDEARTAGDLRRICSILRMLAHLNLTQGLAVQARDLIQQALAIAHQLRDKQYTCDCLFQLAQVALFLEDYTDAQRLLQDAYKDAESRNYKDQIVFALLYLGMWDWAMGNAARFCEREQAALDMFRQMNAKWAIPYTLCRLAEAYRLSEGGNQAKGKYLEALIAARDVHYVEGYCYCFEGIGGLALAADHPQRAARLFSARAKLRTSVQADDYYPFMIRQRERQIAEARTQLGEEIFIAAWAAGQAMNEEEMLRYALEDESDS